MPSTISRVNKHRRSRRTNLVANAPQPANPIQITSSTNVGTTLTLIFDQPVSLHGTPAFTVNVAGASAIGATQPAPNQVIIQFSAAIDAATTLNVGFRDPAIRSASGGYVVANEMSL